MTRPARRKREARERASALDARDEERDYVATLLDTANAAIFVLSAEGLIVSANRTFEVLSGWEADYRDRPFDDLVLPEHRRPAFREHLATLGKSPALRSGEGVWIRRDGEERRIAWSAKGYRDPRKNADFLICTAVDITARAAAEDALRSERDLLETLLDLVPAIVLVSDTQGRIVRFNRAAQETSGLSLDEVKGKAIFEQVLPPEDLASSLELFAKVTRGDVPQVAQTQWIDRTGARRQLAWKATGLRDENGRVCYVIGAAMDLTGRLRAEEAIKARQEELSALHRVHMANELAAILAHELNQPLAAIATYGETGVRLLAARGADAADSASAVLRKITEQAKRAGDSIRALRRLVSATSTESQSCDVGDLVASACNLIEPAARQRNVRLELKLPRALPWVSANPVHVEHVLTNLMRNAIEAIRDSGLAQGVLRIHARRVDNAVQVSVEDSGPGIGANQAESIFEPFLTTKEGGLGMGLRISRRLVEEGGGRLWVEPHQPGGRFHFTLPLAT